MALTAEGRRLTEAHRLAQARIGARTVRQMLAAWSLLDPRDLDRTLARWLRVVLPLIGAQRLSSTQLAASYLVGFRAIEVGPGTFAPRLAGGANAKALITSLTVTGPVSVKMARARGETLERAFGLGQSMSARAGLRFALDGGRETLLESVRADSRALGWARATSGNPCAFCAMLASRGGVYGSEDTAGFQSHDGCQCGAEPIYGTDAGLPPGADQYRELWDQTGSLAEFRAAYDAARS